MEFLKVLGEELYSQIEKAINEHNGNEANKDNQIKIGNLGKGDYVGKAKYEALDALLKSKEEELTTANGLIDQLKKGTKGNEELQGKITQYETTVADLQSQLNETKIDSAFKVGLLAEKCNDVDYVTYVIKKNLKEQGKTLELDENGNIKGWVDLISGAKTQLPTQFASAGSNGFEPFNKGGVPGGNPGEPKPENLADALRMQYENK